MNSNGGFSLTHPWVPICLALIAGIMLAPLGFAPLHTLLTPLILTTVAALGAALWRKSSLAFAFALVAFGLAGAALHTAAMNPPDGGHIANLEDRGAIDLSAPLRITGVLAGHPDRRPGRLMLEVDLERLGDGAAERRTEGRARITIYLSGRWGERVLPFRSGDRVDFIAELRRPDPPRNPGGFDYRLWLRRKGITHVGYLKSPAAMRILSRGHGLPLASQLSSLRASLDLRIRTDFSIKDALDQKGALLRAMLLGQRGMVSEETNRLLRRTGLLHVLAISGLHVWLLGAAVFLLLRAAMLPPRAVTLLTIIALACYWALAGGRASAARASLVAIVFLAGRLFHRKTNNVNNLAFAAFAVLLVSPGELYQAGFQFTFAAALSLSLLYRPVQRLLEPLGAFGKMLALSVAAVAGTLPLAALNFNIVTLHGALTTVLLLPLMTLVIFFGFIYLAVASILPAVGGILAALVGFLLGISLEGAGLFDKVLPVAVWLPTPPIWLVTVYYAAFLLWPLLGRLTERRVAPALPLAAAIILLLLNPFNRPATGEYRLHAIDVGQGESLLLETPDGAAALIDGGGTPVSDYDVGEHEVCRFLWNRGHSALDLMVSTHSDTDHIEGLVSVARYFPVRELWITTAAEQNDDYLELLRLVRRRGGRIARLSRGRDLEWRATRWLCFNPPNPHRGGKNSSNANSLVALLEAGDRRVLLTGDAGSKQLREIALLYGIALRCDLLKVPHHGSDDALCPILLDYARPDYALISAGARNVHGFPREAVIAALAERGIEIYRTDRHGAVSFTLAGDAVSVSTADPR